MAKANSKLIPRYDLIDLGLTIWLVIHVYLTLRFSTAPVFPATYTLFLLFGCLFSRRVAVPETRRATQFLGIVVLAVVSGSEIALTPASNTLIKNWATVVLLVWAFGFAREFMARAFSLTAAAALQVSKLRALFLVPAVTAVVALLAGYGLLEFWANSMAPLILLSSLLVPFSLNWLYLRQIPPSVALDMLEDSESWRRTFGSPVAVLGLIATVSLLGYLIEMLHGHNYFAWSIISALMLLQTLVILEMHRWTSQASN